MDFLINNLNIILLVIGILFLFIVFYSFIEIISLIKGIKKYLNNKNVIDYNNLTKPNVLSIDEQVEVSKDVLALINRLIEIECNITMKSFVSLNKKYEYTRLSEDIKIISTEVYNGLNKKIVFDNPNILLTNDYIMKYISQQTSIILLSAVMDFNANYLNNT